jgi:hypothetical protein
MGSDITVPFIIFVVVVILPILGYIYYSYVKGDGFRPFRRVRRRERKQRLRFVDRPYFRRIPFMRRPLLLGAPDIGEWTVMGTATTPYNVYALYGRIIDELNGVYEYNIMDYSGRTFEVYNMNLLLDGDIINTNAPEQRLVVNLDRVL